MKDKNMMRNEYNQVVERDFIYIYIYIHFKLLYVFNINILEKLPFTNVWNFKTW